MHWKPVNRHTPTCAFFEQNAQEFSRFLCTLFLGARGFLDYARPNRSTRNVLVF